MVENWRYREFQFKSFDLEWKTEQQRMVGNREALGKFGASLCPISSSEALPSINSKVLRLSGPRVIEVLERAMGIELYVPIDYT